MEQSKLQIDSSQPTTTNNGSSLNNLKGGAARAKLVTVISF